MMWKRAKGNRIHEGHVSLIVAGFLVIMLLVFSNVAEASWSHLEGGSEILAAGSSPVSTVIKQAVGRSVSLLMMAVGVIIAVPLVIACLGLSVSYVLTRISRHLPKHRRVDITHGTPSGKLSNKLTGYQVTS
jgi:hypothetical protein